MGKKVLVTGAAGFIGFHTITKLIKEGFKVIGLDNINDYYSPALKYARLKELGIEQERISWFNLTNSSTVDNYQFVRMNIEDKQQLFSLFQQHNFEFVINLAAQAGVRYSIENPDVYIQSNIIGFHYILEACRAYPPKHLIHASSSSVYGSNAKIPFSELDTVDTPVSLYAATKKSNELMAYSYSKLYNMPITCLRFFTVYGPWGRPDMAPMLFADAILKGQQINIFNKGDMARDFTFVLDIVEGIYKVLLSPSSEQNDVKYEVVNIGNGSPVNLMDFIGQLEVGLGIVAKKNYMDMQPGDVSRTWADTSVLDKLGPRIKTDLKDGIEQFVNWYNRFYIKNV